MFKRLIIAFHSRLQERTAVSYEGCFFFIGRDWYKYTWAWDVPTSVNTVLPLFLKILFHVEIRQVLTSHPVFDEENNPWSSQFCSLTRPPNLSLSVVNALLITLFFSTVTAYLLTYLLTPWCRVLLEKLTGLQLVKKFPAFHGTWRFITALTSIHHLSLSWANPIQSIYPHPTPWRSILILSTHLRLGLSSGRLPSGFPTKTLYTPSPHPYAPHAQPIPFFSILSPAQYWVSSTFFLLPFSSALSLWTWETKFYMHIKQKAEY